MPKIRRERPDSAAAPFARPWPRYWPCVALPSVPFLPGSTPREARDPASVLPGAGRVSGLTTENWKHHCPYLLGVDLFNHGFWWEAHEQWELPWRQGGALQAAFLQGLIQSAASLLKWHLGNDKGRQTLGAKGVQKLHRVHLEVGGDPYMGVRLSELARKVEGF